MITHNPFAAPSADLSIPSEVQTDIRKPRSVWVMQFLGGLVALGITAGFALSIYGMASAGAVETKGTWLKLAWASCLILALLLTEYIFHHWTMDPDYDFCVSVGLLGFCFCLFPKGATLFFSAGK